MSLYNALLVSNEWRLLKNICMSWATIGWSLRALESMVRFSEVPIISPKLVRSKLSSMPSSTSRIDKIEASLAKFNKSPIRVQICS